MISAFVDASVLFAAAHSSTGAARDLVKLAILDQVTLVASQLVLMEAHRNLANKSPEKLAFYLTLLETEVFQHAPALTREEILEAAHYTAPKDAAVIAAACKAKVDYLVTYDRKHLIDPPEVSRRSGLRIVTPDIVVQALSIDDDREGTNDLSQVIFPCARRKTYLVRPNMLLYVLE